MSRGRRCGAAGRSYKGSMPQRGISARARPGEPVRVLLMLASLHGGGAERVAVNLAAGCDPKRIDLHVGLLRRAGPYLDAIDPARLHVAPGGGWLEDGAGNAALYRPDRLIAGAVRAPLGLAALIREVRPHVAVSFMKGVSLAAWPAMALAGSARPVWLAREGNNVDAVIDDELASPLARRAVKGLVRACYHAADGVLANSQDMARGLRADLELADDRVHVAPNPVDFARIEAAACEPLRDPPRRPFVVAAGRLESQKGHDLLLRTFAASRACDGLDLVILGEGRLRPELEVMARELGVAERVRLEGFAANPWAWFARARAFVLASRWEGFPNALLEAMACATPVIATACDYGPREVVEDGRSGLLVPVDDAPALASALDTLLADPDRAAAMGREGRDRARAFALAPSIEAATAIFERLGRSG